jgi:hypothetical protein
MAVASFARFIRIADRLGEVAAGSIEADRTIQAALGLVGPVLPYTTRAVMRANARLGSGLPPKWEA